MKWIVAFITSVFTIAGILIIAMGFGIHAVSGSDLYRRALELKLLGAFFIASPWLSMYFLKLKFRKDRRFHDSIIRSGIRRKAVLVEFQETGTYINNNPEVRVLMQVEDEDGTHRNEVFTGIVPFVHAAGLEPGMKLGITESHNGMVIHWDKQV